MTQSEMLDRYFQWKHQMTDELGCDIDALSKLVLAYGKEFQRVKRAVEKEIEL